MKRILYSILMASLVFPLSASADDYIEGPKNPALYQHAKDDDKTFAKELSQAIASRTPQEELLEVRAFHAYALHEYTQFKDLSAAVDAASPTWNFHQSHMVKTPAQFAGFCDWLRALAAFGAHDDKAFESNIKEAMWDNPQFASFYSEIVVAQRRQNLMATLKVPLDTPMKDSTGTTTTLGQLCKGSKAIMVNFWASWCRPSVENLPQVVQEASHLSQHGVAVAFIDLEGNTENAEKERQAMNAHLPWLMESKNSPYAELFQIDSIPEVILISADGSVLFNGHSKDGGLVVALHKLGVREG